MTQEYQVIERLKTKISELRNKVAALEASEKERAQTKQAVRKIEEHFRFNGISRAGTPSFFWFPRF
jgi:phage shock protein A